MIQEALQYELDPSLSAQSLSITEHSEGLLEPRKSFDYKPEVIEKANTGNGTAKELVYSKLFSDSNNEIATIAPVFFYKRNQLTSKYISLQKWEGVVLSTKSDYFEARVTDLSGNQSDEYVELFIDDVPEDDYKLLVTGSIFYWNIGYLTTRDGQKHRTSQIRFRRLPVWTSAELERANKNAKIYKKTFNW